MQFKKLELTDAEALKTFFLLYPQRTRMCDHTVGTPLLWRNYFNSRFAIEGDSLFFMAEIGTEKEIAFCVTAYKNKREAFEKIKEYCKKENIPPAFCFTPKEDIDVIGEVFGDIEVLSARDWFDYLYNARDLIHFSGNRYHGQKNHLNRFKKLYPEYSFNEITPAEIPLIKAFFEEYIKTHTKDSASWREETDRIFELLDNYSLFPVCGGSISAEGKIIAFSVGEKMGDTLFIHVEKALTRYSGSYQVMVNEFAKFFVSEEIVYINREDDMGDEGLRRSKLSYHPVQLIEKHFIRIRGQ